MVWVIITNEMLLGTKSAKPMPQVHQAFNFYHHDCFEEQQINLILDQQIWYLNFISTQTKFQVHFLYYYLPRFLNKDQQNTLRHLMCFNGLLAIIIINSYTQYNPQLSLLQQDTKITLMSTGVLLPTLQVTRDLHFSNIQSNNQEYMGQV